MNGYVPVYTKTRPILSYEGQHLSTVHAWYEWIPVRGRHAGRPIGSRTLCGKQSNKWCLDFDGLDYDAEQSLRNAVGVSWFGPLCQTALTH